MIIRPTKTIVGREATLDTSNRGVELVLAYAAIGDQGGLIDDTLTALRNERDRVPLYGSRVSPTQLHLDALFENGADAYWVREVGLFDTNGVLIYFWSTEGSELGHKSANMDWLLGLELHVDEAIESHVTVNAPSALFTTPATTERRGIIELATEAEAIAGTDAERAITPATLAAVMDEFTAGTAVNADKLDGLDSTDFALKTHLHEIEDVNGLREELDRSVLGFLVKKPSITTPANGTTGFSGAMSCSAFAAQDEAVFFGAHDKTHWEIYSDANLSALVVESSSGNLTSYTPSLAGSSTFFARVRHGSDNHWSDWSSVVEFSTGASIANTPTLTVQGAPYDVHARPSLSTSPFVSSPAGGTHTSTDWKITKSSDGSTVHEALASSSKTQYTVPGGVLQPNTNYVFAARHNGTVSGFPVTSAWRNVTGETRLSFLPEYEMARLFASDGSVGDHFGNVTAMNDLGNMALCGSPMSDLSGKVDAGAAYYFDYGTSWGQRTKITAADSAAGDNFGSALAMSGDGAMAAIVAHNAIGGLGAVYIFTRSGSVWTQAQKITVPGCIKLATVDMSGDGTVVVIGDNIYGGTGNGKAYVFVKFGSTWEKTADLVPSDSSSGDGFGLAVAITRAATSGQYHIVVGAPEKSSKTGAAYVFVGSGSSWTQQAKLTPSGGQIGGQFGFSVALTNTRDRIVIGAPDATVSGYSKAGAIYPYAIHSDGVTWNAGTRLVQSAYWGLEAGSAFGRSVAVASNATILAGQPGYSDGGVTVDIGRAYVLEVSGNTWIFSATIESSSLNEGDAFGISVAVPRTGSLTRALIGAYDNPLNTDEAGSAYVYTV